MKKTLLRTFHVFMAVVVLLSSTGFGLVEHSCTMRGKTTAIHKSDGSCCNKKNSHKNPNNQTQLKKSACCSEDEKYENVEYSSSVSQLVAKFAQKTVDTAKEIVSHIFKVIFETVVETVASFFHHSSVIAHSGRDVRVMIQSFTI